MSSLDPSIIQVASFKCRADVPLGDCHQLWKEQIKEMAAIYKLVTTKYIVLAFSSQLKECLEIYSCVIKHQKGSSKPV